MLKRICILMVILLLILPYSFSGTLYTTANKITYLEEPIIIAVDYVASVDNIFSIVYDLPILSTLAKYVLHTLLGTIGVDKLKPGVNNIQHYAGVSLEKTSFSKMTQSWDLIRKAMREQMLNGDPTKSIEELRQGMLLASDAFLEEEAYLINDARMADRMGLDNMNYSEYGGTVSEENWEELLKTVKTMEDTSRKYSADKLETIQKNLKEEQNRLPETIAELALKCNSPTTAIQLGCISEFLAQLNRIASKLTMDDYYNRLFGTDSVYTRLLSIRGKLNMGMKLMVEDWKSKKELYESLEVKIPNIQLKSSDVSGLFDVEEDPEKWVGEGEKLLWESEKLFKEALWQRNREYEDDYLYKALTLLDEAITLKYQALNAYRTAENIETNWKRKIDTICSEDLVLNSQLALKYYEEGKKLCASSDYLEKLDGAKRIKYAQKVDTAGFEKNILLELDKKISDLERMIRLAKVDKLDTSSAEAALEFAKKSRQKLANMSPDQVAIEVERINGIIKSTKKDILRRAYYKYRILETLRKRILLAKDFLPRDWTTYEYMFDGYNLNVERGLGSLMQAKTTYENLLDSLSSKGTFNMEVLLLTKTAVCNKRENAKFILVVENPLPVDIARPIKVAGKTVWISLGPYEYKNITYTNKTVLVTCSIVDQYRVLNGTAYEVVIRPKYQIEKVYLPYLGDVVGGSKLVRFDAQGMYVENVDDELVVTVIVQAGEGESQYLNDTNTNADVGYDQQYSNSSNQEQHQSNAEQKEGSNHDNLVISDPDILPPFEGLTDITSSGEQASNQTSYKPHSQNEVTTPDSKSSSAFNEEEYSDLLKILEQNTECTYLDVEYLRNNPSKENLELVKDEIKGLKDAATSKLNSFIVFGYDDLADKAKQLISENRYCEVLNMTLPDLETANITGLSTMTQYNLVLPVIAVIVVAYLVFSKRKPPENKIIRILKSSE